MSEVHRYKVVKMLSEGGNKLTYSPHGPYIVMAEAFDAEHALRLAGDHQVEKLREQLAEVIAALEASHTALAALACLAPQHRTEAIDQAIDQAAFTLSHAKAHPINSDHRGRVNE